MALGENLRALFSTPWGIDDVYLAMRKYLQ
jgi:hypothetical protein